MTDKVQKAPVEEGRRIAGWKLGLILGLPLGVLYGLISGLYYWTAYNTDTYVYFLRFTLPEGLILGAIAGIVFAVTFASLPGETVLVKSGTLALVFFAFTFVPIFFGHYPSLYGETVLPFILSIKGWQLPPYYYNIFIRRVLLWVVTLLIAWMAFGTAMGLLWSKLSHKTKQLPSEKEKIKKEKS